jgi:putative transposase
LNEEVAAGQSLYVWREEFETLEQARQVIGAYIDGYHHRPHSGLAYRTPREVAAT